MQSTLAKPWGKHPAGTIITDEPDAPEGAVRVNGRRFEALQDGGFFAGFPPMELPIPPPPSSLAASKSEPASTEEAALLAAAADRGWPTPPNPWPPPPAPAKKKEDI